VSRRPLPPGRTAALLFAGVLAAIAVLSGAGMILRGGELELFVHYWNGHLTIPFAALGFIQIFVAIAMTWALLTTSRPSKIEMDDGGVRWSRGSARGYVPFASVRDAAISSGAIGGSALTLAVGDAGERIRLPLSEDDNPSDILAAILRRVVRGAGAAPGPSAELLRRGRRDLSAWLT
jgi:hypothetical protein